MCLGLLFLGAAAVYWPMSLYVEHLTEQVTELRDLLTLAKEDGKRANKANEEALLLERSLADLPGGDPGAELGLLLDEPEPLPTSAGGSTGGRVRAVS